MLKKIKEIKKIYWILFGVVILIVIFFGVRKNSQNNYSSYTVTKTTVSDELLLAGTIDAKDRVDLGFATSGRIKKVYFEVGDEVKKGQIIAEIEQNRLQSELTQAQANYVVTRVDTESDFETAEESLETQLAEQNAIVQGLYQTYLSGDLQAYNTNSNDRNVIAPIITGSYLGIDEGEYIIEVYSSSTNSGYSFRLSGLERGTYTAEVNQAGKLGELGLYIQFNSEYNYANTDWVIPVPNNRSSTYISRKSTYENAVATRDRIISSAKNNLDRVSSIESSAQISLNEARRQQANAQVNAVYAQLGDGKIYAPFDGIIAKNDLEVGEIVTAFSPEIIIFGDNTKELNLNTPEIYINKIEIGDAVSVTLDAYPDIEFEGKVDFIDFIDTEVDGVPVYKTDIVINTEDSRIRSGMNAKARVISESKEDIIAVPAHYIQTNKDGDTTVLIELGFEDFKEQVVETGIKGNEGLVEIVSGLKEGQVILFENN